MNIGLILTPPHKAGQNFNIAEKYDFSSNYLL
jgi:alpha-galactosidase